jgi:hypothetical protein
MGAHHLERAQSFDANTLVTLQDVRLVWLGDPAANEVGLVGAKAANLSRLANSYRVPAGSA